jgi:4-amino-4-deoxy-L-arabinose transferase-like glycosyltransferase
MRSYLQRHHRLLFYSSWLILTIIQSRFTELLDDEAYYWVYSKFLDWGYFDHPPMIALLIKTGYSIFHNELGVRLVFVLMNLLSLMIIEKLIERKDDFLFYTIALSLAVLQLSGFVAVPDTPLIFFTALFFLVYKNFLQKANWKNILLLGLVTAAMMYSKYHSVLILFFVLISNPKLFVRYQTYLAGFIALVLFLPHLWWQYQHDWISFRYQLFESNVNKYQVGFTLDYILGQILLAGPIAGIILLPAAFIYRTKNLFERSLKFTLVGIYLFFLLSSLRGKVEGNWTSPAIVEKMAGPIISYYTGSCVVRESCNDRRYFTQ